MKTAILISALVCLFGYTQADDTCTVECSVNITNKNLGLITTPIGINFAVDVKLNFTASIGAQYGFFVFAGTDVRILVHKTSRSVLYINGNAAVFFSGVSSVSVIFDKNQDVSEAITTIKSQCESAAASAKTTFNFSVLLQASATIDQVFTGNADVSASIEANFGAAFQIVKKTISKMSISSVTINVFVAISFDSADSVDVDLVEAFDLILQIDGSLKTKMTIFLDAYTNNKLAVLVAVLKIGDNADNYNNYRLIRLKLTIQGKARALLLVYGNGNFYLTYNTEGEANSTISLIVNGSKKFICISNSIIGYTFILINDVHILYCHSTSVGLVFNSSSIAIITAATIVQAGVRAQGGVVTVLSLIAYSSSVTVSGGITIVKFVQGCAQGSAALGVALGSSVSSSVAVAVFNTYGALFARFNSIVSFSIRIDISYVATVCFISSSRAAVVTAFGGAIQVFVQTVTQVIGVFTVFYPTCSTALSVLFQVSINFG